MDIIKQIVDGTHDSALEVIEGAIISRKRALGLLPLVPARLAENTETKSKYDFKVGDRVVFNKQANPRYLQGVYARVVGYKTKKIRVQLEQPTGKFGSSYPIGCPVEIVDKV